ncbi:MAG TPA: hypothetical protein PL182_13275 [Pseudobdellovibrionaceae bacterium]|nr:hypothetical protein [Pseudobdellovibrionaceae bacterium]
MIEALVVSPALAAFVTLFLSFLLMAGAVSLLQDRLDETLVCLTYRPRSECENDMRRFIRRTGLSQLDAKIRLVRNGSRWTGQLNLRSPWGKEHVFVRSIDSHLSKNFR